ncbi:MULTISPECIES: monovalent cation/H+ antiporter subunit D [Brucella/Ochrobactrum group]|jgi:multicomponent K+:H+ antiporter subunit D|uniref:Monovalent cation/H+ antiporter subunit D n=1 Tax=Brucella pseudintermedia TaxID=370111 RepID=A0ABY5UGC4_9HYPH|nr:MULTISPECIES: monovalent cation/H+ antiporter subunit D [Brucella/Ochrobactrum group]KAB2679950.1 monovalent cation/H+ antiporter subunit D [Brucella pseudintermedia]MCO7727462.1 monovalent cation/H+ antiporter subunit D [Brucella intermedia]NKE74896.1 monovalent cation/H+ antiporter subunit D [Ochrobactrum sp. MC-1LL]TWH03295.1 multisubunit potassium/proton antiporter PhaD subunit [Ochrobactrum sp. J50]UWL62383.1 monovalent cation/H+ antiporter subunit D [Brucella pseudintermedia]
MLDWKTHLIVAPIVLPLLTAAVLLLFDERKRKLKMAINSISTLGLIAIAITLAGMASEKAPDALVYLIGNWPAPFGIVLVLDRLAALMLVLTSLLGMASLSFALAHWHKASPHFHTIFQLLLMGLNGAFLTGDLFNLFVFFEVMLAASYGLALHGSGPARVKAGMHYIAVNLVASSLFLIGVSLIYGVTGTLNMADLAQKISQVAPEDRMLLEAGAAVLGVAFLVKAGMWPLNFWLAPTYTAAAAPVAAVFAIMSKVGIYVLLRLSPLMFGIGAGSSYGFGNDWLYFGGMVTLAFGLIGVVASQAMGRLASYSILVSSGTLLAAIGSGNTAMTGAALFYMVSSTLTIAAFFLLIELIERGQDAAANVLAVTMEAYGDDEEEEEEDEIGAVLPATLAVLGTFFGICAILLIGLPPFSGFIAKFLILAAVFNGDGPTPQLAMPVSPASWTLVALILLSGLSALIAMTRTGIRTFWASLEGNVPRVLVREVVPIAGLLAICLALTIAAGPAMRYMDETARSLHNPASYISSVLNAPRAGMQTEEAQ